MSSKPTLTLFHILFALFMLGGIFYFAQPSSPSLPERASLDFYTAQELLPESHFTPSYILPSFEDVHPIYIEDPILNEKRLRFVEALKFAPQEITSCLFKTLGEQKFSDLLSGIYIPSSYDAKGIETCLQGYTAFFFDRF